MAEIIGLFESHGLVGLVIGALFGLIITLIFVLERKDKKHSGFMKTMLDDAQQSRDRSETRFTNTTDKLADAIKELTENLKT